MRHEWIRRGDMALISEPVGFTIAKIRNRADVRYELWDVRGVPTMIGWHAKAFDAMAEADRMSGVANG